MKKLFPGLLTIRPERRGFEEQIESKKAGMDHLTDMLRAYAAGILEEEEEKKFFTLYHIYRQDGEYAAEVERLVRAAFIRYEDRSLGRELARLLYGQMLLGSVSRLEKYASCAYAHFLQYGLSLKEREEYGFEAVDMGNIFHGVLEKFAGNCGKRVAAGLILTGRRRIAFCGKRWKNMRLSMGRQCCIAPQGMNMPLKECGVF